MQRHLVVGCCAAFALAGCVVDFSAARCRVDADCGDGLVCEEQDGRPICIDAADAPLVIGESAPISGTNQELGTEMKLGIELAFQQKNASGGVRGRKLELRFYDDAYRPELAERAAHDLTDALPDSAPPRCPTTKEPPVSGQSPISKTALRRGPGAVLAFLGNVGTPTMVRSAPVAIETGTLFFGAFTGATTLLRDDKAGPCRGYIFNVRASYAQEAHATLEYFKSKGVVSDRHLISFDQDDSFGQAGYDGLLAAYAHLYPGQEEPNVARFRYTRNDDDSVPAQAEAAVKYLRELLSADEKDHVVGVLMTDTYGAAASFITAIREWQYAADEEQETLGKAERLTILFSNVSFVGPDALARRLVEAGELSTPLGRRPLTDGVMVSQVVPNYDEDASETVREYNRLLREARRAPSFTSLEGYIAALVFISGLEAHRGPFTPDALIETFEGMPPLSLGLGASAGFSADNHQYSSSVWGTSIEPDGAFRNVYFWSANAPIEFFE